MKKTYLNPACTVVLVQQEDVLTASQTFAYESSGAGDNIGIGELGIF